MEPAEPLRAYAGDTNQTLQTESYNNPIIASDSYNFLTGTEVMEAPLKESSRLQAPISEEGTPQNATSPLIGTLYSNQPSPSSGSFPTRSSSVPKSNSWETVNGTGLYSNSNLQNIIISASGMMAAPTSTAPAQLLISGLHGGSFDSGHSEQSSVFYPPSNNQEAMQLFYVNAAGFSHGYHSDGHPGVTTLLYPSQDGGSSAQQATCDQNQQQYGASFISPALAMSQRALEAAGSIPFYLQEHSASRSGNQNYNNWRNGGNEHSFLPMNEEAPNHQSQFDTDLRQYGASRACHDLSRMHQTDHLHSDIGLQMDRSHGISITGQGLSLSLSSHQPQATAIHFQSQLHENDHLTAVATAAAIAKTKELATRYLAHHADLSRFRTPSREDVIGVRYHQDHINIGGRKHQESNSHSGPASSSNHFSASRFLRSGQAILNEVCRVTSMKRVPNPARSSEQHWSMAGGSSASIDGNLTFQGKEDRSGMLSEVDSVRDPASASNTSTLAANSHVPSESEVIQSFADAARTENRDDLELKKGKLGIMLDEVEARYRQYCDHLQLLITGFNSQAGPNTATPYTILALQAMSRHFRCLRDAIGSQLKVVKRALGEDDRTGLGETSRLRYVDQQIRQQRALQQLGMLQQHAWRPQRGLPERAVSVLRAWLFEHFLHPYPKDVDKMSLAKQTGLTRSQVSNWFINARVRLWKPMVEEMYLEEQKEADEMAMQSERIARDQVNNDNNNFDRYEGGRGHSGLLHEISANGQNSNMLKDLKNYGDKEQDVGPSTKEGPGGIGPDSNNEIHSQLLSIDHHVDGGAAGNYNEDGREAKKPRNIGSDAFNSNSALFQSGMSVGAENCTTSHNVSTEGEDNFCKGNTDFVPHTQSLNQITRDEKGYSLSDKGTGAVELEPNAAGAFGTYDGSNIHRFGSEGHTGYLSRASGGPSTSSGVSLTLGLRHSDANLRASIGPQLVSKYKELDDQIIRAPLKRADLPEGRIDDVNNTVQPSSGLTNGRYSQIAQDNSNSSNQQLSPGRKGLATPLKHHESVAN